MIRGGPASCPSSPTSGNAWARWFLQRVFPIPEDDYRICADDYVYSVAPLFGLVRRIKEPQGFYRRHGQNNYAARSFERKLSLELRGQEKTSQVLSGFLRDMGIRADTEAWKKSSWWNRVHRASREIAALVPPGETFVLVDNGAWGMDESMGRRPVPFLERKGLDWGAPDDDAAALGELERWRRSGVGHVVFGWTAFWWFDHFPGLTRHLRARHRCVLEDDDLVVFDLRGRCDG
jgi:hypothetical protein